MEKVKLLTVCLAFCNAFCLSGCKEEEYDYTAEELVIAERDSFAPCYFNEFLHKNEYTTAYFGEILLSTSQRASYFDVTIDGRAWKPYELHLDKLPQGLYDIVIETPSDFYMVEQTETGLEKVYIHKKLTVSVFVSELNEDKYSIIIE